MTSDDRARELALLREFHALPAGHPKRTQLRDTIVQEHLALAHYLAKRMAHRREVIPDLVQVACIGLINAVDRFDPDKGASFSAFAVPTMTGEIKRYYRDSGWYLHVPRGAQELQAAVRAAETDLSQEHGRSPTPAEVAERLGITPEDVVDAHEIQRARDVASLDVPGRAEAFQASSAVDERFERIETRELLRPALAALTEREREIVLRRFVRQSTQAEIAKQVGLSQMQVSRLLARSLHQMRDVLEDSVLAEAGFPLTG